MKEKMKSVSITLPPEMLDDLDAACRATGLSRSLLIRQLIRACQSEDPTELSTGLIATAFRKAAAAGHQDI